MMNAPKKVAAHAVLACVAGLFVHTFALATIPVQHWTQPGGAQVYLVESPAVAMLDVQIDFDAGSRRDPPAQAGLAGITAELLEKGVREKDGAPALDENALGEAWADLGAQFGAGATSDRMSFSLRSLTDPALLDRAVALAARQIAEPAYPDAVWQRERQRLQAALKESYTRPGSVIGRAYSQAVYGSHPYGYEMTEATLAAISVADMQAAHAAVLAQSPVANAATAQAAALAAAAYASQAQATNPDTPIRLNPRQVAANFTVPSASNAASVGPLSVSDGVTVTVLNNATWSVHSSGPLLKAQPDLPLRRSECICPTRVWLSPLPH